MVGIAALAFQRTYRPGPFIFFHLDKSDGLSDNTVTSVVSDENGLIWIGTLNGLNSYDGYTVRNFFVRDFPGLQTDVISRLVCDHMNRIWIHGVDGREKIPGNDV